MDLLTHKIDDKSIELQAREDKIREKEDELNNRQAELDKKNAAMGERDAALCLWHKHLDQREHDQLSKLTKVKMDGELKSEWIKMQKDEKELDELLIRKCIEVENIMVDARDRLRELREYRTDLELTQAELNRKKDSSAGCEGDKIARLKEAEDTIAAKQAVLNQRETDLNQREFEVTKKITSMQDFTTAVRDQIDALLRMAAPKIIAE